MIQGPSTLAKIGADLREWYVVQAKPNMERRAAHELERQSFVAFVPSYLKRRRHARRVITGPASLFPGYLFVSLNPAVNRWRAINSTIGVARLLSSRDGPCQLPLGFVEELLGRCDATGCLTLRPRCGSFSPGDKVRVLDGSFTDAVGLYEGMRDNERVTLLLDLLGRRVRVEIDALRLEKVT
jgi:transcriptional antiterminator RfaH